MSKYPIQLLSILSIATFLSSCLCIQFTPVSVKEKEVTSTTTANCPKLPENFKESDLLGKWIAEYTEDTDTLILSKDGKYKQIYDNQTAGIHYESDWQTWWVEERNVGYLWLHMEGMRRCDDFPEICLKEGGGTDSRTIDICENIDVREQREVILVVTGADFKTPHGIVLRQTRLAGSEWSYYFVFQNENGNP